MAFNCSFVFIFLGLFLLGGVTNRATATTFNLLNNCPHTVWPATLSGNNAAALADGGLILPPGASFHINAPRGWSGRFWARTNCNFNPTTGTGTCLTGDCGGNLHCPSGAGGVPPVSLVEFTLNGADGKDFYDVSLVDGYNVGIGVRPINGGTGNCQYAGCVTDLNSSCPPELQVKDGATVVACMSACAAFNRPEFCCTGDHGSPLTCSPTHYSALFKNACPTAYSYAYDDASSTCTCTASDYLITFCPTGL